MEISKFQKMVAKFRDDRNWKQYHTPKDLILAATSELGELSALYRWKNDYDVDRNEAAEEIADVMIFLFNLADVIGVDMETALNDKLSKNGAKYPEKKWEDGEKWEVLNGETN